MRRLLLLLTVSFWVLPCLGQDGRNVLVVVNKASADSKAIGDYYADRRGIPPENICRINAPDQLVIDRRTYNREVREPVADHLRANELQDRILYIVTTKGVPLIVEGDDGPVGDRAAVDSELTLLYRYLVYGEQPRFGRTDNPYFAVELRPGDQRQFRRQHQEIFLVTRLTGPSAVEAILLVDRALQPAVSEGGRFYFDFEARRNSMLAAWVQEAADGLSGAGYEVRSDLSSTRIQDLQAVAGLVSLHEAAPEGVATNLQWQPGGAALMLAAPLDASRQILDVVRSGATALVTSVGDAGRDGQLWPQIFFNAFLGGHNLAESAGLALRYLSWRNIVIGDPLARPYPVAEDESPAAAASPRQLFRQRRIAYLGEKYGSGAQAISLLIDAEKAASQGELEQAQARALESQTLDPGLPDTHLLLARLAERREEFQVAFEHYTKILELTHDQEVLHRRLAQIAVDELDDPDAAEPHARWLFANNGLRDVEATRLWAEVRWKQGKLQQAEALFYRLTGGREEPVPFALVALGELARQQGELTAARDFFQQALDAEGLRDPERVKALIAELEEAEAASSAEAAATPSGDLGDGPASQYPTRPARVVHRVAPEYPFRAVEAGQQGRVLLLLLVDERGQLLKHKVIQGEKRLVKAVVKTLPEWQFEPQLINGRPVVGWVTVAVIFKIDQVKP